MILFFDTETTGKADLKRHPDDPCQPRLVQLAAILTDEVGSEISSVNLIVKPNGYEIPEDVVRLHGITNKLAHEVGIPINRTLHLFHRLATVAKSHVAHNIEFDQFILTGEFLRQNFTTVPFDHADSFCTMNGMTDHCKLPGPYGNKWPTLQEAYQHAFGMGFKNEHDAMADVRACIALHFWLQKTNP